MNQLVVIFLMIGMCIYAVKKGCLIAIIILSYVSIALFYFEFLCKSSALQANPFVQRMIIVFGIKGSIASIQTSEIYAALLTPLLIMALTLVQVNFFSRFWLISKLRTKIYRQAFSYLNITSYNQNNTNQSNKVFSIIQLVFFCLILLHVLSYITAYDSWSYSEYLSANKPSFYYFFPQISALLAKICILLYFFQASLFSYSHKSLLLSFTFIGSTSFLILYYSSINSRWAAIIPIIYILSTFNLNVFKSWNKLSLSKLVTVVLPVLLLLVLSFLLFVKTIEYRSQVQGLQNALELKSYMLTLDNLLEFIFIPLSSIFGSMFALYSAYIKDLSIPESYNLISLSPLPSAMHGVDTDFFKALPRIGPFGPSPGIYQITNLKPIFALLFTVVIAIPASIMHLKPSKSSKTLSRERLIYTLYSILIAFELLTLFQYNIRNSMRLVFYTNCLFVFLPLLILALTPKRHNNYL